jgi:hypothetical protein
VVAAAGRATRERRGVKRVATGTGTAPPVFLNRYWCPPFIPVFVLQLLMFNTTRARAHTLRTPKHEGHCRYFILGRLSNNAHSFMDGVLDAFPHSYEKCQRVHSQGGVSRLPPLVWLW